MTGYLCNGYCEVPPVDVGNHSVAGKRQKAVSRPATERGKKSLDCFGTPAIDMVAPS